MEFEKVKDSGERRKFGTGAVRDMALGKGRYDLISPLAMKRLAKHYQNGSLKYGDRNWEKGIPLNSYLDSAMRHLFNYLEGLRDEDHLSACLWNVSALIHMEEMIERGLMPKSLNNLPNFTIKGDKKK
jgi:hypothetical protein